MSVAQIREAIAELSAEEREELSEWLAEETIHQRIDPEAEAESVRIANQRLADFKAGRAKMLTEEEFWAGVRERYPHEN